MAQVIDLTTCRAWHLAQAFRSAYERQAALMGQMGLPCQSLTPSRSGDYILADLAACRTVATSLPRLGLSGPVLQRLRQEDAQTFSLLSEATRAYDLSPALRAELGRIAVESFDQLRAVLVEAA
ncbi:hypothetical protein [Rubellimicrobium aerolatum]|uniref:Nucleotidyltransferase n=1 Tax=Rubellimicrobium aerolatum TaxID=490979 RepID=A0ABW0S7Y5_9RHOB|nr:hypothetical protein [Rubellimicrobium aerolatum]MBP1804418.1 hypothetical protein [Rubellimicrobium aerolatum]